MLQVSLAPINVLQIVQKGLVKSVRKQNKNVPYVPRINLMNC